ncbi:protease SohB [Litoribrevibacter albus]|uniref:Protease n=1 Tax=Litoribrevibacter albus TaxID=1473156 RepID=A0AA37SA99_9GAMM|nr:protease SohB [Litoribrevibacter albus]GLQ32257.1 protease [Litoribrevibacter albus]
MGFWSEYSVFLAQAVTVVLAIIVIIGFLAAVGQKNRREGHIEIKKLNDKFEDTKELFEHELLSKDELKEKHKAQKKADKEKKKAEKKEAKTESTEKVRKRRVFVIDFDGDVNASAVSSMREEISAVLTSAEPCDEVVVRLESPGGVVHGYGLAASQLDRIRKKDIPLTICVDKVAASGGYMMACLANKIIAAPFAIVGSIGVVAQIPNIHRLLKKNDIDVELHTAGEFKRTLTVIGENTDEGREKFKQDLQDTHDLFKSHVSQYRPELAIDKVANGDIWYGTEALNNNLIDEVMTSDEYLMQVADEADVFEVKYEVKKSFQEKLGMAASLGITKSIDKVLTRFIDTRTQIR